MKSLILCFLLLFDQGVTVVGQVKLVGPSTMQPGVAAGGGSIAIVNHGSNWTGSGSTTASVTAGNHLVVFTEANDATTTHTCSDGSNTYVDDGNTTSTALSGHLFHVKTLASTTTITITCTGTTPAIAWVQYSGGSGDLDTAAVGSNPSKTQSCGTPCTPAAMTPTAANTLLVDAYGSPIGGTITLTQVDGGFTTQESCLTGASCFVGGFGTRILTSASSVSDGWTVGSGNSDTIVFLGAYK